MWRDVSCVFRSCPLVGLIIFLAMFSLWGSQPCQAQINGTGSGGVTYTLDKVWSDGTYNAFTDLTRYANNWYLVFRTASTHGVPPDGQPGGEVRVLKSTDGQAWTTAAVLSGTADLRDPKISVTPNNQLMVIAGDTVQSGSQPVQSAAWFSSNGSDWGKENPIGDYDYWMWRTVWHNGVGYGVSYGATTGPSQQITTRLSTTTDGLNYTTLVPQLNATNQFACEAGLTFLPNGTAVAVVRQDGAPTAAIGTSSGDYTHWTFANTNLGIDSPNLLTLPNGQIVCGSRLFSDGSPYTGLSWVDPSTGTVTPFLEFPHSSWDDTAYPGLYWYNDQLWVSYYSTINGTADIYVAQVSIPGVPEPGTLALSIAGLVVGFGVWWSKKRQQRVR